MSGDQRRRLELAGPRQEIGELDRLVAADAGHRRVARDIAVDEIVDHRFAEAALEIEHIMGDAELGRDPAGIMDVLAGAAGALAPHRLAMIVELERDADDLIARPASGAPRPPRNRRRPTWRRRSACPAGSPARPIDRAHILDQAGSIWLMAG